MHSIAHPPLNTHIFTDTDGDDGSDKGLRLFRQPTLDCAGYYDPGSDDVPFPYPPPNASMTSCRYVGVGWVFLCCVLCVVCPGAVSTAARPNRASFLSESTSQSTPHPH